VEKCNKSAAAKADTKVLRTRLAECVGAEVPHARIGEVWAYRERRVIGGAVVDDDEFPVSESLRANGFHRFRQKAGVVLRSHHNRDGWHHTLIASMRSRATFEMQNRYLPLASCGIASTSSTSCATPSPKVS